MTTVTPAATIGTRLRGYRGTDEHLLSGPWPPGELLGLPMECWPALADPTTAAPPTGPDAEVCVVEDTGFVGYRDIDWVHRRARVEIGLHHPAAATDVLFLAVEHGFGALGLHRLYGWVTVDVAAPAAALELAGFAREARVPATGWLDGRPVDREVWAVVRDV